MKKIVCIILCCFLLCSCKGEENVFVEQENNNYIETYDRPSLLDGYDVTYNEEYTPQLQSYKLNSDFSNIINPHDVERLTPDEKNKLLNNLFVVSENINVGLGCGGWNVPYEFFGVYQDNNNFAVKIPSFVTTDSMLHAFHLLYEYLQKRTEKNYLINRIHSMSLELLNNSIEQLNILKGTEWENAAQRNVDYFSVAIYLCGDDKNYISSKSVETELKHIYESTGIYESPIFTTNERTYEQDYSQFEVRGYYTDTEELQKYFKVMQWYGQMTFTQSSNELNRSALLINLALKGNALKEFECVYETTSFFAGDSDDNTYYEYYPIIEYFFGDDVCIENIIDKTDEYEGYLEYIKELEKPRINSLIVSSNTSEDIENETVGYRLIGQRASLDSIIMDNLTYPDVKESTSGNSRNLPSALDVPAAFGSDLALEILKEYNNVSEWPNYDEQMNNTRQLVNVGGDSNFESSVSSAWFGTLNTLLETKSDGWPSFMQTVSWNKKNLATYLGSYTELKHDLILYQKQPENGRGCGDFGVDYDDRGYVEPQPNLFHRLSSILTATTEGLSSYQLISSEDIELINELKIACDTFESISIKELNNVLPTNEEFDYIRNYGDLLYKLWDIYAKEKANTDYYEVEDYPSCLVTDVATDFENGLCLELGNGKPMAIYVAVYFDGEIRIARGVTYSNYEFTMPISNRLNDHDWKQIVYSNNRDMIPPLPLWYEDIYAKDNEHYSGTSYMGSNYLSNNISSDMITSITEVNVRDYPSTKTGKVKRVLQKGENLEYLAFVENEGYIWYQIGYDEWIADDGTWFKKQGKLNEEKRNGKYDEYSSLIIQIMDTDMGIYSSYTKNSGTGNNVYNGETYYVLRTYDMRGMHPNYADSIWYQIGANMYIKDSNGSRIAIIN